MISPKYTITKQDASRWIHNTKRFFFPALAVYLMTFTVGWVSKESALNALPVAILFLANSAYDLITKWVTENEYK